MGAIHFLGPQPVDLTSSRQVVHAGVAVNASGNSGVLSGFGQSVLIATIRVNGAVTGTSPVLDLFIDELDPSDPTPTVLQSVQASSTITATGQTRTLRLHLKFGDAVRVRWVLTGTSPVFNTVYTTLVASNGAHPTTIGQLTAAESLSVVLASDHGAMPFETEVQADFHTGGTTQNLSLIGIALPSASGAQVAGVVGNPIFTRVTDGTNTMPTADTAARAQFSRPTDGTNSAVFKAASTPAAAADPALVVAVSPNNTIPINVSQWFGSTAPAIGQNDMANSIPVTIANDQFESDILATGTIGALNGTVTVSVAGKRSVAVRIDVGSLTGTIVPQVSYNGSVWSLLNFVDPTTGDYFFALNVVSGQNPYYYIIPLIGGHTAQVRLLCTAYTSGTSGTIAMRASPLPCNVQFAIPYTVISKALFVRNTDGVNTAAVKAASTAAVAADPAMVVALSPNSPLSLAAGNQNVGDFDIASWIGGSTAPTVGAKLKTQSIPVVLPTDQVADVIGQAWFQKITDGVSTAAVKAASTAPAAADPALVVSISPNGPAIPSTSTSAVLNGVTLNVTHALNGATSAALQLTNTTFVGTLVFHYSYDGSQYWAGGMVNTGTPRTRTTSLVNPSSGVWYFVLPPGVAFLRVVVSAFTSGQVTARIISSSSPGDSVNIGQWFDSPAPTVGQKVAASSIPIVPASDWVGAFGLSTWIGGSTAPTVGQKTSAQSIPVVLPSDATTPDTTASGTLGALSDAVTLSVQGKTSVAIRFNWGTLVGTVALESTVDGVNWNGINLIDWGNGEHNSTFTSVGGLKLWVAHLPGGINQVRMRCTAYTSGATSSCLLRATVMPMGITPSISLTPDYTIGGTFGAAGETMVLTNTMLNNKRSVLFRLAQGLSLVGTLVAEATIDNVNWFGVYFLEPWTGLRSSSIACTASGGASYHAIQLVSGVTAVRVRCSAYTSGGSSLCTLRATAFPGLEECVVQSWLGSTAPTVGQKTSANSIPVVLPSDQVVSVNVARATTSTPSTVTLNGASQTALAANVNRKGATVWNHSTAIVYVAEWSPVTSTSFTMILQPGTAYDTDVHTGIITVLGTNGAGTVLCSERV